MPEPLTAADLAELRAAYAASPRGEYRAFETDDAMFCTFVGVATTAREPDPGDPEIVAVTYSCGTPRISAGAGWVALARFIALAHNLTPSLLAELDRLKAEACHYYLADGSFDVLGSPEEVVARRIEAAGQLAELDRLKAENAAFWRASVLAAREGTSGYFVPLYGWHAATGPFRGLAKGVAFFATEAEARVQLAADLAATGERP